jgi:hypothetical protein
MQYFGFFVLLLAIGGLVFGFLQRAKMKKILAAPFKKTGEIAQNPQAGDAKGLVSCEGAIQVQQPLVAPCSGKPCIYYKIEVERMWEKTERTENGVKTRKGTTTVSTKEEGAQFWLNDGSGPVPIDAREKVNVDEMQKAFEQGQNVSYGDLTFGSYQVNVPYSGGDETTTGIRAIEKIVPAEGNLFIMGKLAGGAITKEDGMLGKLTVSTKGREKMVGTTKRNMMIGLIAGGVLFAGGGAMAAFGDPPKDNCANLENEMKDGTCSSRVSDKSGKTHDWKVSKAGVYSITVRAGGSDKNARLWPHVTVLQGTKQIADESSDDREVKVVAAFDKGDYKIKVNDVVESHAASLKGGASYTLEIKAVQGAEADAVAKMKKGDEDEHHDEEAEKPAAAEEEEEKPAPKGGKKK